MFFSFKVSVIGYATYLESVRCRVRRVHVHGSRSLSWLLDSLSNDRYRVRRLLKAVRYCLHGRYRVRVVLGMGQSVLIIGYV